MKFIPKTGNFPLDYAIRNPHSCLHFASFFKFMHANVSATFIVIRALPYNCVYRNPWFSFAVPKILSIVSFLCEYSSFIPSYMSDIFCFFYIFFPNMTCYHLYMILAFCTFGYLWTFFTLISTAFIFSVSIPVCCTVS